MTTNKENKKTEYHCCYGSCDSLFYSQNKLVDHYHIDHKETLSQAKQIIKTSYLTVRGFNNMVG